MTLRTNVTPIWIIKNIVRSVWIGARKHVGIMNGVRIISEVIKIVEFRMVFPFRNRVYVKRVSFET